MASNEIALQESRPAFLAERGQVGTEGLNRKVRPSRTKIVQKNSSDALLEKFSAGTIIVNPDEIPLCLADEVTGFVPLMWYSEYCKMSANALRGTEPYVVERSYDERSPIAIKASSPQTWSEPHPKYADNPKYNYRYVEYMNFIILLTDPEFEHIDPLLLSFGKTNYSSGQRLAKLILQRRASIFAGKYELGTRIRENQENSWRVYTVDNNKDGGWVADGVLYDKLAQMSDYFSKLHESRDLEAEYEDDVVDTEATTVPAGETGKY